MRNRIFGPYYLEHQYKSKIEKGEIDPQAGVYGRDFKKFLGERAAMGNLMKLETVEFEQATANQIQADIFREIYKAGKIPDTQIFRRFIRFLLRRPVTAFSRFIARIDALVG